MTHFRSASRYRAFRNLLFLVLVILAQFNCDFFDILPPEIEFISPEENVSYFGTLPIELKATDNRKVTKVEVFLDNVSIHEFTKAPYKADLDISGQSAGTKTLKAIAYDQAGNYAEAERQVRIEKESISIPNTPTGPTSGTPNTSYTYSTGGASSSLGHSIQYRFDWGDGSYSNWSSSTTASHAWSNAGSYNVKAQARCASHTGVVSSWSSSKSVTISSETISAPSTPTGPSSGNVGTSYSYSTGGSTSSLGHSVEYRFDWGDGSFSTWSTSTSASHSWSSAGTYSVKAQARCATHTTVVSSWSGSMSTSINIKLLAPDAQAADYFGTSVSISGDYAIVGADRADAGGTDAGAVYIFHRTGTSSWDSGVKLTAPDAQADDSFGNSVSISGDYAIVGAGWEDAGGDAAGAAYIFYRTGLNSWDGGFKLVAPDAQAGDVFGYSVAISGEYAVVGAVGGNGNKNDAGAAYVFRRTGLSSWDTGTKIIAPSGETDDRFGWDVAISGDYIVVGTPKTRIDYLTTGATYVFRRTGPNSWDDNTRIYPGSFGTLSNFGSSVAISGDYIVVGAVYYLDTGGAFIFNRTDLNAWNRTEILAADRQDSDYFGSSVDISGNKAIIGAHGKDNEGNNEGAAYIFQRLGTTSWDAGTKITAPDAQAGDSFGTSVSISGDYAIVGADQADAGGTDAGAAYIFK